MRAASRRLHMPSSDILLDKRTSFFIAVEKEDDTIQAPLRCEDLTIFRVKLRNIIASFVESLLVIDNGIVMFNVRASSFKLSLDGAVSCGSRHFVDVWHFSSAKKISTTLLGLLEPKRATPCHAIGRRPQPSLLIITTTTEHPSDLSNTAYATEALQPLKGSSRDGDGVASTVAIWCSRVWLV